MKSEFKFGLETEYIITNQLNHKVLWYEETPFHPLYKMLETISLEGIPSLDGLDSEPAHLKILPFVVEGYHLKDEFFQAHDMHPKGVEIRSPVCSSIEECIDVQRKLFSRLLESMGKDNKGLCILSHHPWAKEYSGPQANRPEHFWKWALKAMMTYGPDINISWDSLAGKKLFDHKNDFEAKLNYYAPALVAFSAMSPFFDNKLGVDIQNKNIRSVRTMHRSEVAPLIEWHEKENFRLEFKFFDMPLSWEECRLYFDVCLILMLSDELTGRASLEEGKELLKMAAIEGLSSTLLCQRLQEILKAGEKVLPHFGFSASSLKLAYNRLEKRKAPADYLIEAYQKNVSMEDLVKFLSSHYETESEWVAAIAQI
jgi:carboxylate-amine ligase